jgi:predicted transcriptional regulator
MSDKLQANIIGLTVKIVSAHVANNQIAAEAVPSLIKSVYHSLATASHVEATPEAQAPAVPVKKSVFPEYIICLEDGKKMKMLKRHLQTSYNMTPDDYRTKWGLPRDYPMVAPIYAAHRSTLAKKFGLGNRRVGEPAVEKLPARRARGSKR